MLSLVVKLIIVIHLQVESIVLSIISMLSSPNDESAANIEAAVSLTNTLLFTDLVYLTFTFFGCCNIKYSFNSKLQGVLAFLDK
jgi:hypothetical protein